MKINESIWGTEGAWIPSTTHPSVKFPDFGSLYDGVEAGRLEINELLDDSINFVSVGKGVSDWFHPYHIFYDTTIGKPLVKKGNAQGAPVIPGDNISFFPAISDGNYSTSTVGGSSTPYVGINKEKDWGRKNDPLETISTSYTGLIPMVDFDYSKMIYFITITAFDETLTNSVIFGVEDYYSEENNYTVDYPNITSIRYECLYGDPTSRIGINQGNQASTSRIYIIPNTVYNIGYTITAGPSVVSRDGIINYLYSFNILGGAPNEGYVTYLVQYGDADEPIPLRTEATFIYMNPEHWDYRIENINNSIRMYPIFKGTKEDIYAKAACLGCYFTGSHDSAVNGFLGEYCEDPLIHLPVITNGSVFGDYKSGVDTVSLPNSSWGTNVRQDTGYEGEGSIDNNDYTESIPMISPTLPTAGLFNTSYVINANQVYDLAETINQADEEAIEKIKTGFALLGENPINGIIGLKVFPFDVSKYFNISNTKEISIGKWDTGIQAYVLNDKDLTQIVDLGTFYINPYSLGDTTDNSERGYVTFLNFEPYTTIELYIPYCGIISLPPSKVVGTKVNVKMTIDFYTGACNAVVYIDNVPYTQKSGVVSIDIPITGTDSSAMTRQVVGAVMQTVSGTIGAIGSEHPAQQVTEGLGHTAQEFTKMAFTPTPYQSTGTATPANSFSMPQYCYMTITYPKSWANEYYGHTIGWAVNFTNPLRQYAGGLIKANNPRLDNVSATLEEKNLIEAAIAGGIILEAK